MSYEGGSTLQKQVLLGTEEKQYDRGMTDDAKASRQAFGQPFAIRNIRAGQGHFRRLLCSVMYIITCPVIF